MVSLKTVAGVLSFCGMIYTLHVSINGETYNASEIIWGGNISASSSNETDLSNFTYTLKSGNISTENRTDSERDVDCLGLGTNVAKALRWFLTSKRREVNSLRVNFTLSSRNRPQRVYVSLGEQFGLEWTDFNVARRTVVIVHGFLSTGGEQWITDMEQAFLQWGDVNVLVVDWSEGGNTWNYYKAAINTRIVGHQISSLLEQIMNATIIDQPNTKDWGPLHLIGHSLGAHICGFAAKSFKKYADKWPIKRITGLDPAQPCFNNEDQSMHLHKTDAQFVDIIHTNGRLLSSFGLGVPDPLGDVDFYPNGGRIQPGCMKTDLSVYRFLPIPQNLIQKTICSHGRSYVYLTESLKLAMSANCSFWGHHWDRTFRNLQYRLSQPCSKENCTEMGIRAEFYPQKGTFFVATANNAPFCVNSTELTDEVRVQLIEDHNDDIED